MSSTLPFELWLRVFYHRYCSTLGPNWPHIYTLAATDVFEIIYRYERLDAYRAAQQYFTPAHSTAHHHTGHPSE